MLKLNVPFGFLACCVLFLSVNCSKGTETRACNPDTVLVRFGCTEPTGEVTATAVLEGLSGQTTTKQFKFACPGTYNLEVSVTDYRMGGTIKAVVNASVGDEVLAKDKLVEISLTDGCTSFDVGLGPLNPVQNKVDAPVVVTDVDGGNKPIEGTDAAVVPDADQTSVGVARGGSCARNDQCTEGFCVDSVCCDKACDGLCMACTIEKTGSPTGQCTFTKAGVKHSKCNEKPANSCETNGMCNGAGQCSFWDSAQECVAATCTGGDYVPAQKCSGAGACQTASPSKCGEYACSAQGCKTSCTVAGDCSAGVQCIGGKCGGKRALGEMCSGNGECTSPGFCIDGVCCGSKCDGKCESCNGAQSGGNSGECLPVPASKGNQADCVAQSASSCGTTGRCDGARKCEFHAAGTECAGQMCGGATQTSARKCDGGGTCLDATTTDCSPGTCDAPANQCRQGCTNDNQCASGAYCDGSSCRVKKGAGGGCGRAPECGSNFCAPDGKCCNQACTGSCFECSTGSCKVVTNAEDPGSCSGNKSCSGAGTCLLKEGQECAAGSDCGSGTCTTYYRDADNDTYGVNVAEKVCGAGSKPGYAGRPGDCCDTDIVSHPFGFVTTTNTLGPEYQQVKNACGSWDWDCDGFAYNLWTCTAKMCKDCSRVTCTEEERTNDNRCANQAFFTVGVPECGQAANFCSCYDGQLSDCGMQQKQSCR